VKTIKDYAINLYWDARAGYFVAEIPEIPTCSADGARAAEALANLEATFAVLKEVYHEENMVLPEPNPDLPISVGRLSAASSLVKMAKIAELAGIPVQTLAAKVKRGTELSLGESRRIAQALSGQGVFISHTNADFFADFETNQSWASSDVNKLRQLAEQNTPTRIIGLKLGRSEASVYKTASEKGIPLRETEQGSYRTRTTLSVHRSRKK
jgi:predicted RNase H-like HicB family nuclease